MTSIAEEDNPAAADRVSNRRYSLLHPLPYPVSASGHRRTDLMSRPLRFWSVRDFLIAYAPDEKPLLVIAVVHARRSPRVLAALLRSRE